MSDAEKILTEFLMGRCASARAMTLEKGAEVRESGENVILILCGTLDVYLLSKDGTETLVSTLSSGCITGISNIFSPSSAESLIVCREKSHLLLFNNDYIQSALLKDTALFSSYAALLNEKIHFLTERIGQLSASSSTLRLAEYLLSADSEKLRRMKKADIAKAAKLSRSSFYRALAELEDASLISAADGTIVILDRPGLLMYS